MTKTRDRGTIELERVRRRRRRRVAARPPGRGRPYLLDKLLSELAYGRHDCRSCGFAMVRVTGGFWWCDNCADFGRARARRSWVGSSVGRSS